MTVTITDIQPNPIQVVSGQTVLLAVSAVSLENYSGASIVIKNMQPAGATLFDSNEESDKICSDPIDITNGLNHFTHQVGFKLDRNYNNHGAIIGVEIYIQDSSGNQISAKRELLATIGGAA